MKNRFFSCALIAVFAFEIAALLWFAFRNTESVQDAVVVNEAVQSVRADLENISAHVNETVLDYVVIDKEGKVIFKTKQGLSESVNAAVVHRDTILDLDENGTKIIVYNDSSDTLKNSKNSLAAALGIAVFIQIAVCTGYLFYLDRVAVKPFRKLKGFAQRVAGGNLDIPLEMDRGNLFGAFTESFDIMRSELKKARISEAKANASKKELVAKLSHDIRTPVASIKAAAELGAALSESEKTLKAASARENFSRIISKADQINTLVGNLFSATLEELQQLTVSPADMQSTEICEMLESADYFRKTQIPVIPDCIVYADKLRLQQVFDNIFANSYKYANTEISVKSRLQDGFLLIEIEDFGGGVSAEELPLLKEKFKRGSNSKNIDGAGLGLYISSEFMTEMKGELIIENGQSGLKVTVKIALSGKI